MNKNIKNNCIKYFGNNFDLGETPQGQYLFSLLDDFVDGSYMASTKGKTDRRKNDLYRVLTGLKNCEGVYPEIIRPNTNILYRATEISRNKVKELILKKDLFKELDGNQRDGYGKKIKLIVSKNKITYKAKSIIQSWTTTIDAIIGEFGNGVILKATIPYNQIVLNDNFIGKYISHSYGNEKEIIRLTNQPIKCDLILDITEFKKTTDYRDKEAEKLMDMLYDLSIHSSYITDDDQTYKSLINIVNSKQSPTKRNWNMFITQLDTIKNNNSRLKNRINLLINIMNKILPYQQECKKFKTLHLLTNTYNMMVNVLRKYNKPLDKKLENATNNIWGENSITDFIFKYIYCVLKSNKEID